MTRWRVLTDRRVADLDALRGRLRELAQGVEGLDVDLVSDEQFEQAPDAGAFRDFTPVATLRAPHLAILEYASEALLDEFDWIVDFEPLDQE